MTLSDQIRARMASCGSEGFAVLDWVLSLISDRAKASRAHASPESMRRGGKTRAARSAHYAAMAERSNEAQAARRITAARETARETPV